MKTFGYLLMAVMACMTCSCRDEEPLPDPVPPVMEPENPGNPEEPDTGKVYIGIAPIIENMQAVGIGIRNEIQEFMKSLLLMKIRTSGIERIKHDNSH